MFIRSQDKMVLMPIGIMGIYESGDSDKFFDTKSKFYVSCDDDVVGFYSTKEKALKVLDMIQKRNDIIEWKKVMAIGRTEGTLTVPTVTYEMPQDDEID